MRCNSQANGQRVCGWGSQGKLLAALSYNRGVFTSVCSHETQDHPVRGRLESRQRNAWGAGRRGGRGSWCSLQHLQHLPVGLYRIVPPLQYCSVTVDGSPDLLPVLADYLQIHLDLPSPSYRALFHLAASYDSLQFLAFSCYGMGETLLIRRQRLRQ